MCWIATHVLAAITKSNHKTNSNIFDVTWTTLHKTTHMPRAKQQQCQLRRLEAVGTSANHHTWNGSGFERTQLNMLEQKCGGTHLTTNERAGVLLQEVSHAKKGAHGEKPHTKITQLKGFQANVKRMSTKKNETTCRFNLQPDTSNQKLTTWTQRCLRLHRRRY